MEARSEFGMSDLLRFGLQGTPDARDRRIRLGNTLNLGYGNARQLLRRLNHLGVTREEAHAEAMKAVPLGRMGRPEEVAGMVAWLVSDEAHYITGIAWPLDAGFTVR